ncbi:MFS transporter [Cellulophaga baltica]|uniref:MFS transporter n=1 Tax=Cellulophaga TaxID=104264 RepID=UPI001C0745F7|nr:MULTISPECIES: MFS transporter [Cellulophaga]MBU2998117.1 MFS transporter [Cellulophaga baltica]MDO6769521.1 MFS transporter [Cellulophaga sp. 1_MG-2023]
MKGRKSMFSIFRNLQAVALLLAASLTILSNTLISPSLPGIQKAFQGQANLDFTVPFLITAPSLMVAISALLIGVMADKFNRRLQLMIGVVMFASMGSAGLWLGSLESILVSRFFLGISIALMMTAQTALIGEYFKGQARDKFMGVQISATNFSGLIFIIIAGWLANKNPFYPFAIYLIALLYVPVIYLAFFKTVKKRSDKSTNIVKIEKPKIHEDSHVSKNWVLTLVSIAFICTLSLAGFYIIPTRLPFYLVKIGYPEPSTAAALLAFVLLAGGTVSLMYSAVRKRFGRAITFASGFAIFALGFIGLSLASSNLFLVFASTFFIGAATGLITPIFFSIALDIAPSKRHGFASGMITTALFVGQFISPILSQPIIRNFDYSGGFKLYSILFLSLGIISFLVFRKADRNAEKTNHITT